MVAIDILMNILQIVPQTKYAMLVAFSFLESENLGAASKVCHGT